MKVKIINSYCLRSNVTLDEVINDFIKDKKVIDIKFQSCDSKREAMIIYEE